MALLYSDMPGQAKRIPCAKLLSICTILANVLKHVTRHIPLSRTSGTHVRLTIRVRRYVHTGCPTVDVLVLEEFIRIGVGLYYDILQAHVAAGIQIILCGDTRQLFEVYDSFDDSSIKDSALRDSDFIRQLVKHNSYTLTTNQRSDSTILNFITNLDMHGPNEHNLDGLFAEARLLFPKAEKPADWMPMISYIKYHIINWATGEAYRPPSTMFYKWAQKGRQLATSSQSFWCWPGQTLIGAGGRAPRGILDTMKSCYIEGLELMDGNSKLIAAQLVRSLRPYHAIMYASRQGLTLRGREALKTDSKNFMLRHLLVGCSRATAHQFLEIH